MVIYYELKMLDFVLYTLFCQLKPPQDFIKPFAQRCVEPIHVCSRSLWLSVYIVNVCSQKWILKWCYLC